MSIAARQEGFENLKNEPDWYVNRIHAGDVRSVASKLPAGFANCIVTSPPYFGHRKYDDSNSIAEVGREKTLDEYVSNIRDCFSSVRNSLREDGTLWLNLGDTYRDGQLLGVPWRVAFALQSDGWILRSDIIWHKPNAMPSSVKTRPTVDHEYMFMFSRSSNYYYDTDSIREPHVTFGASSKMKGGRKHLGVENGTPEMGKNAGNSNLHNGRWDQAFHPKGRNRRTVWSVPLGKSRDAHFAVFPERLIEPCILAGSPEGGVVLDPFMGSGTTAAVCKRLDRNFVGIELVDRYVEIAEQRLASTDFMLGLPDESN